MRSSTQMMPNLPRLLSMMSLEVMGGAVTLNLDESPLVDELTDRLKVGSSPGDVGLTDPQHVGRGLVQLHEHAVVDLPQSEQLEDLLHLGGNLVDTTDPHHKGELGVAGNIVVSLLARPH